MKKTVTLSLILLISQFLIITGCVTSGNVKTSKSKKTVLDSCIVDENYDFVFEIINNTDEAIFFTNGIKENRASFSTLQETMTFIVNKGESYQLKYDLGLIEKKSAISKEKLQFYIFMSSENNTVIDGNEKSICIYEKDGRYINDRHFYRENFYYKEKTPQPILADRKYILTLSNKGKEIDASCKIEDLSGFVYDDIVPGDGKSPIKLQLRNSKNYIEVDWQYCRYHKENRGFSYSGNLETSISSGDWQICQTGKALSLVLNYNRNNDYYCLDSVAFEWDTSHSFKIRDRDYWNDIRPYTVEELETLIGVKEARTSADGIKLVK